MSHKFPMRRSKMRHLFSKSMGVMLGIVMMLCLVVFVPAQNKRMSDARRHANDAVKVFNEIMMTPDKAIPKNILDKAEAVAIFPGVVKAAFIVGGRGGQGIIVRRVRGGWSAP